MKVRNRELTLPIVIAEGELNKLKFTKERLKNDIEMMKRDLTSNISEVSKLAIEQGILKKEKKLKSLKNLRIS